MSPSAGTTTLLIESLAFERSLRNLPRISKVGRCNDTSCLIVDDNAGHEWTCNSQRPTSLPRLRPFPSFSLRLTTTRESHAGEAMQAGDVAFLGSLSATSSYFITIRSTLRPDKRRYENKCDHGVVEAENEKVFLGKMLPLVVHQGSF